MKNTLFITLLILTLAGACPAQTQFAIAVGGTGGDDAYSIFQTSDGGYAVAGGTTSFGAGDWDLFFVKFSLTGSVEWSRAVGGTSLDFGYSVVQTSDGGFAVAGRTESFGAGSYDFFLVKFDSEGNTCIGEEVFPIVTDITDSIIITDVSPIVNDVTPIVKEVSPTITEASPTVTEICTDDIVETIIKPQGLEITVLPNPFNSSCAISAPKGAKVEIFDIDGRKIAELADGQRTWTPNKEIGSGIYLVRATTEDKTITKRIVLMK